MCHQEKALTSKEPEKVIQAVTCNSDNKDRECNICRDEKVKFSQDADLSRQVFWLSWKTKRIEKEKKVNSETVTSSVNVTCKEKDYGYLMVLLDEVNKDMQRFTKHTFNIRHQYRSLRYLRENLAPEELIIHIDISENYNCKYANEIQSMHFGSSHKQISLHTGVAYTADKTLSFCSISDCLKHSPAGIWAHLHPILEFLRRETNTSIVHFVSDGPTTQCRNKQNFFLLANKVFEYGFDAATWNFLEAGHGKGAADGIGAVIKRTADAFVNKGGDITCASDMVKSIESSGSTVKIVLITHQDVEVMEEAFPLSLKPIPRSMQIHQIMIPCPGTVSHRVLSCFCSRPNFCSCFRPETAYFSVQTDHIATAGESFLPNEPNPNSSDDSSIPKLEPILEVDESLISRYCVIKYNGKAFPGIILSVDGEEEIEVKAMHRVGRNRFFWPMVDDIIWYATENVLTLLESSPTPVTKRHLEVDPKIWELVERKEDF